MKSKYPPDAKPPSWYHPFRARAELMAAKKARKAKLATEYRPEDDKEAEKDHLKHLAELEGAESLAHVGDRSYRDLSGDGTFRRVPVRYDE